MRGKVAVTEARIVDRDDRRTRITGVRVRSGDDEAEAPGPSIGMDVEGRVTITVFIERISAPVRTLIDGRWIEISRLRHTYEATLEAAVHEVGPSWVPLAPRLLTYEHETAPDSGVYEPYDGVALETEKIIDRMPGDRAEIQVRVTLQAPGGRCDICGRARALYEARCRACGDETGVHVCDGPGCMERVHPGCERCGANGRKAAPLPGFVAELEEDAEQAFDEGMDLEGGSAPVAGCLRGEPVLQYLLRDVRSLGLLVRVSPGDTLRFLHAVKVLLTLEARYLSPMAILASEGAGKRSIGLLSGREVTRADMTEGAGFRWYNEDFAGGRVMWMIPAQPMTDRAQIRAVVGRFLRTFPQSNRAVSQRLHHGYENMLIRWDSGLPTTLVKLDDDDARMMRERCSLAPNAPPADLARARTILVFLRLHDVQPDRNSPGYHVTVVQRVAHELGLHVRYAAFAGPAEYATFARVHGVVLPPEHCICYGSLTYLQQLRLYEGCLCAVGVNSSPLDLASVAGVPVLRDIEFQFVEKRWGARYNWFLARALNLGLAPTAKPKPVKVDQPEKRRRTEKKPKKEPTPYTPDLWQDEARFELLLRRFLELVGRGYAGRGCHVVLPFRRHFNERSDLRQVIEDLKATQGTRNYPC